MFFDIIPQKIKKQLVIKLKDFSFGADTSVLENLLPMERGASTYNFRYSKKGLEDGLGLSSFKVFNGSREKTMVVPEGIERVLGVWIFHCYDNRGNYSPQILIYADDGKIYSGIVKTLDNEFLETTVTLESLPLCYNFKKNNEHLFYFCSSEKITVAHTSSIENFNQAPAVTSLLFHGDKLFAILSDENKLFYSSTLDITQWNMSAFDGDSIELNDERGAFKKLLDGGNSLYIIRDYGITSLNSTNSGEFVFNHIFSSRGRVYPQSATLCGKDIYVLCQDGLYCCSGNNIKKIDIGIEECIDADNSGCLGAYQYGKYYLACRLNFNDSSEVGCESGTYVNNAIIEYDINSGNVQVMRGVDVCSMSELTTKWFVKLVLGLRNGGLYEIDNSGSVESNSTKKFWSSGYTDFGYAEFHKVLKRIHLNTASDIKLNVLADGVEHSFLVAGNDLPVHIPTNIRARKFSFSIQSEDIGNEISNVELEVDLC